MKQRIPQPELKNVLVEATHALAHLDADRLEEMALSCAALVSDENRFRCETEMQRELECGKGMQEMAIFARVLEATRANLRVMRRLCEMRAAQLEYGGTASEGIEHGDH